MSAGAADYPGAVVGGHVSASHGLAPAPERYVDVLSNVLSGVRLTASLFFWVEATSPWVAEAPSASKLAPLLLPQAQHIVSYHLLLEGGCYCELEGQAPVWVEAGDILVIPHGDRYALSSHPGMLGSYPEEMLLAWFANTAARAVSDPFVFVEGGGEGAPRQLLCGFLGCDTVPYNPVLATLPRLLHVRRPERGGTDRLTPLLDFALAEVRARHAGRECVLLKVSELLFVEVVRHYLSCLPPEQTGWLAGLHDPIVGHALTLLHQRPAHAWTVEELAREAGLARSTLAERFNELVGQPPAQYLARWRMQLAARLLADGHAKVSAVALEVGYESEAAFSRAFKALVGLAPAAYRQRSQSEPQPRAR